LNDRSNTDRVFHRELDRDYPVAVEARGAYVTDAAGRRYLDGAGSYFVVNVGHGVPEIQAAIAAQLARFATANTNYFTSEPEQRFAQRLIQLAPAGFAKVWMSTSGSAANETALKLARHYHVVNGEPQRTRFIARWNAYHGGSIGALSMTGQARRREPYGPYLLDFPHIEPPYCYRCPFNLTYPGCKLACADALEREIRRVGPQYVAAFIVEPVSGGPLGALVPPAEYLPRIRAICDKYGILMAVDEIVTGAGRTGRNFGIDHAGVVPDLITVAKGVGGGFLPIGATLVHRRVYDAFESKGQSFRHGETFTGHAVIAAAGVATLDYLAAHDLVRRADEMGAILGSKLKALGALPMVGDVRGIGLLWGLELVRDKATKAPFARAQGVSDRVGRECMKRGLLVVTGVGAADGVDGDTICLAPPFVISPAEIDEIVRILGDSIGAVAAQLALT
jgi:adenosylmethionine-8-amino-7-oxononanoate aminotransferase